MRRGHFLAGIVSFWLAGPALAAAPVSWTSATPAALQNVDEDIARHVAADGYFDGIEISETRFSENGFAWHLIRFRSVARPDGPLWMVPHDDEDAGFDAMIAALRDYGGVGIEVNSTNHVRNQAGHGECGVRRGIVSVCDPNRDFDVRTPLFTAAFLDQWPGQGQPIIALHTNSPGFAGDGHGGRGDITILDAAAWQRGRSLPRAGGMLGSHPQPEMANYDTLGLTPYRAGDRAVAPGGDQCEAAIVGAGINFWHERVAASDGSMSNYLALYRPEIRYFNAESRAEADPAKAAARHRIMIAAYLEHCAPAGAVPTDRVLARQTSEEPR